MVLGLLAGIALFDFLCVSISYGFNMSSILSATFMIIRSVVSPCCVLLSFKWTHAWSSRHVITSSTSPPPLANGGGGGAALHGHHTTPPPRFTVITTRPQFRKVHRLLVHSSHGL